MQEWRKAYQQFPWYVRLLKKFFCFKSKIQRWSFSFVNQAELSFLRRDMSIDEIEKVSFKSTHNRRERPVHGHRGRSRGPFYYRITTFGEGPWDARDPHKTTFMTLK